MEAGPGPQQGTLTPTSLRLLCRHKAGEAQRSPPKSSVVLFGLENSCPTARPGLWCCSRLPLGGRQTDQERLPPALTLHGSGTGGSLPRQQAVLGGHPAPGGQWSQLQVLNGSAPGLGREVLLRRRGPGLRKPGQPEAPAGQRGGQRAASAFTRGIYILVLFTM